MLNNAVFTVEEIEKLKNTKDGALASFVGTLLEEAKNGGGYELLALAYYYTGDKSYFERARRSMLNTANAETWIDPDYDPEAYNGFDIRTSLGTGGSTISMAIGFSLFGDLLSDEDRDHIAKMTYEKGILPLLADWVLKGRKIHALDTMGHNFWLVLTSSAALGAVVFKDYIPDGDYLLSKAVQAIESWFKYPGNPMDAKPVNVDNGGYYEAVSYYDYCMHEYLTFANIYVRLMGKRPFDDKEVIDNSARFFLNCWYPSSNNKTYYAGFGDCEYGDNAMSAPLFFLRYGVDVPGLRYHVKTRHGNRRDKILYALLWDEVYNTPDVMPENLSACYNGIGWAIFKDSYKEDSTMLAIKCGDTWNHAHADCCHFNLYHKGKPQIYDTMQADSYSSDIYHTYYVESIGHNVLLFNGKGQDFRDNYKNHAKVPGRLLNFTDDGGFRYVVADGTGPMGRYFRKHHRHFLWMDNFILVYDDVECYEGGTVSFLLHGLESNTFKMLSPADVEIRTGYVDGGDTKTVDFREYKTATDDEHHAKFCGIIMLDDTAVPELTEIIGGWKITVGSKKIYINHRADGKIMHRNCINVMDGIYTDAEIVVDAGDNKYAVANGSIIRRDDVSYLDTFARITGWADSELI